MKAPEKEYYYLDELDRYGVSLADVKYWLAKDKIELAVWLDQVPVEFSHKKQGQGKSIKQQR